MATGTRNSSDTPKKPEDTGASTGSSMTGGAGSRTGMSGGMGSMSAEPPPKVAEAIDEVSDKAKEVVDRASESLKQTTANAAMQLQQAQHAMVERASEAKIAASTQLRQLAEKLRSEVRTGEGQPVQYAEQLSTSLDTLAQYLEMHSFDQIEGDLRRTIQRNPWQSVGLSVFVGWLLAKIFRR